MLAVSFNINSLRIRLHQLQRIIDKYQPDFIGLQETKVNDPDFPEQAIIDIGHHMHYHCQKSHYSVALLYNHPYKRHFKGFPNDGEESQRRFIGGLFESPLGDEITVRNGYFPQGENRDHPIKFPAKEKYYADLLKLLNDEFKPSQQVLLMGDMNVSHQDCDIGIGEDKIGRAHV